MEEQPLPKLAKSKSTILITPGALNHFVLNRPEAAGAADARGAQINLVNMNNERAQKGQTSA